MRSAINAVTVVNTVTHGDKIFNQVSAWLNKNGHKPMLHSSFYTYPNGVQVYNRDKMGWEFTATDGERFSVELADRSYFTPYPNISDHRPCVCGIIKNGVITSIEVVAPR